MLPKKLTREDIETMELSQKDKDFYFSSLEAGADLILFGEWDNKYDLNIIFSESLKDKAAIDEAIKAEHARKNAMI